MSPLETTVSLLFLGGGREGALFGFLCYVWFSLWFCLVFFGFVWGWKEQEDANGFG